MFCENGSLVLKIFLARLGFVTIGLFHKHIFKRYWSAVWSAETPLNFHLFLYKNFLTKKIMILGFFSQREQKQNISKHVKTGILQIQYCMLSHETVPRQ